MTVSNDIEREYSAIKTGAGFCRLDDRLVIRVSGDDGVSFLHGMCTADIKDLAPGQVAPALFVTEHSHVIADCFVYASADALLIEIDRAKWPEVRAHLEKFLVADDVEMDELDWSIIDCEGPSCAAMLAKDSHLTMPSTPWRFDPDQLIAQLPRFGAPAFSLLLPSDRTVDTLPTLKNLAELSPEILEIIRIEHGLARIGVDTTAKTLALEARLEGAISFSKGCYIGQETIERATARGGLKRKLCGLRVAGDITPAAGSAIMHDDKPVGVLTSIARSPEFGVIGLAILHHSAWEAGTAVVVRDATGNIGARVADLPFRDGASSH
jgi:folate-binding protein YgfZ